MRVFSEAEAVAARLGSTAQPSNATIR
jgi:hypothetical protein